MTGEQPVVTEKAPIVNITFDRALVLLTLVGSACGIWGTYTVMQDRVETLRSQQATSTSELAAEKDARQRLETKVAIMETGLGSLAATLNEVKSDIKEIKNSVVFAKGGRER